MAKASRDIDKDLIRELADLLTETDLSEIEVENNGMRIRVARNLVVSASAPQPGPAPAASAAPSQAAADTPSDPSKHPGAVTSPMVGTAYLAAEPGAAVFVEVGSSVSAGQTILIIEAMKTMNAIPAPKAGTVREILVEDGHPVEFGEPLMIIE